MTTKLDPEEVGALRDAAGAEAARPRADVSPRNFAQPRTLSAARVQRVSKSLSARLNVLANALAVPLRGHPKLHLGEVSEVNAQGLFDGFVRPFLVHGFTCAGKQGWLVWDSDAARAACDVILSGPPNELDEDAEQEEAEDPDAEARPMLLSRTESRVVASMLDHVARLLAAELGLECEDGEIWQEPEQLTTLEDLGPDADSRRLLVHLGFEGPGGSSDMRIYLPGFVVDDEEEEELVAPEAPSHLAPVRMTMAAHLGRVDVPLSELLALEVGDVIPLDSRVGDPVELVVEDRVCGRARWGSSNGRLAVVVDTLDPSESEVDPPESD